LLNIRLAGRILGRSRQGEAPSLEAVEAAYAEASQLYPSDEQTFWFALDGLTAMGELDRAVALLEPLFARAPQWKELLRRLDLPNAVAIKGRFGF
jgi:hypothetical protein